MTMGARIDLYKTYYPDPNHNLDSNSDTNPKPDPNPNSHRHFGIVVRSKSAMHRQTDSTFDGAWQYCLSTLFQQCVASFSLPRCKFRRVRSRIKLTMRLLRILQFDKCSNRCADSVICHQQRRHGHASKNCRCNSNSPTTIVPTLGGIYTSNLICPRVQENSRAE